MKHLLIFAIASITFHTSYSSTPEFCNLSPDEGTGTTISTATYFDPKDGLCYPFIYKGEGGNANRFQNERECIRNCSTRVDELYPVDEIEACHLNKNKGSCSGRYLRYYYDSIHDKCKKFLWTGCLGNGNRFVDQESCNATCAGIHDDGDAEEEDEPDTPVAIICGVMFGITGAIIIITVIVLSLQSKKKSKKAPKNPKEQQAEAPLQVEKMEMA